MMLVEHTKLNFWTILSVEKCEDYPPNDDQELQLTPSVFCSARHNLGWNDG